MSNVKEMPLTFEQVDEMIAYDPETGSFTWKKAPNRYTKAGAEAGTFKGVRTTKGVQIRYKYIHVLYHQTPAARVAWLLTHKVWPEGNLQFIDDDPSNLRISKSQKGGSCGHQRRERRASHVQDDLRSHAQLWA